MINRSAHSKQRPRSADGRLRGRNRDEFAVYFWSRVRVGEKDQCWPWTGPRNRKGYGEIAVPAFIATRKTRAHRVAFILENGAMAQTAHILHRCDNPPCCNPRHLRQAGNAENVAERISKGRSAESPTTKLTPSQVRQIRGIGDSMSRQQLGRLFGISGRNVLSILRRETWRSLA